MKRAVIYTGVFSAAFLASALYHLPAKVLVNQLPLPTGVTLDNVQGSVWQGSAQDVSFQRWNFGEVSWVFQWTSLLTLSPEYAVKFGRNSALGLIGKGHVGASFSSVYARSVIASISAQQALDLAPMALPVSVGGQLELVIRNWSSDGSWCQSGDGSISWNSGYIESPLGSLTAGSTVADVQCENSVVRAQGSQKSSHVSSEFQGELKPNRQYTSNAWFKPGSDFPESMNSQLKWLGSPDTQGRYTFNYQGRL
ncbi:type II secretion system protein N [Vibrio sp. ZSDZ34]|uniref:Type II secretion system protein N n=1 Tax=Vibrio gelatinilyticus TaxID=2893468 RepID=A0A9X1WG55_9VIBR|nr:type II secretion system protein N [Vibrio gelatinilyticus]